MKKILLPLLLCLVFSISGCSALINYCDLTGPPNVPWIIVYTNYFPDFVVRSGTVRADGTFRAPKLGLTCAQLAGSVSFGNNLNLALGASPASVNLNSPPATGTISGQSFDTTYGMPTIEYFDYHGYLVGSVFATSVAGDGTSLQANLPNLSQVYSGTYQVKVTNKASNGFYLNIVGSTTITAWGRDRPDSDGDGWYDDEDCDPYDVNRNTDCTETCQEPGPPYTLCEPIY